MKKFKILLSVPRFFLLLFEMSFMAVSVSVTVLILSGAVMLFAFVASVLRLTVFLQLVGLGCLKTLGWFYYYF